MRVARASTRPPWRSYSSRRAPSSPRASDEASVASLTVVSLKSLKAPTSSTLVVGFRMRPGGNGWPRVCHGPRRAVIVLGDVHRVAAPSVRALRRRAGAERAVLLAGRRLLRLRGEHHGFARRVAPTGRGRLRPSADRPGP